MIYLTLIGLILDIFGVAIIYFWGLPEKIDKDGDILLSLGGADKEEIKKAKKYDFMSTIGLGMLIVGFSLQALHQVLLLKGVV